MKKRDSFNGKAEDRGLRYLAANAHTTRPETADAAGASVGRVGEVVRALKELEATPSEFLYLKQAPRWRKVAESEVRRDRSVGEFD